MSGTSQAKGILGGDDSLPPETGVVAVLRRIDRGLAKIEELLLTIVLVLLVFLGVYQLVRVHWFPPAPYWPRELIKYCVLFLGMIAGALAAQSDRLFNIDMFTRLFAQRGKLVIRILTALFTIAVCWAIYRAGMILRGSVVGEKGEVIAPATGILPLPVGALLVAVHMLVHSAIDVFYLISGRPSPDVAEAAPKA
jgi:TRAP-type C4-dicarboxylate transport system permease small subunit